MGETEDLVVDAKNYVSAIRGVGDVVPSRHDSAPTRALRARATGQFRALVADTVTGTLQGWLVGGEVEASASSIMVGGFAARSRSENSSRYRDGELIGARQGAAEVGGDVARTAMSCRGAIHS